MKSFSKVILTTAVITAMSGCGGSSWEDVEHAFEGTYALACENIDATINLGMGIGDYTMSLDSVILQGGTGFSFELPVSLDCSFADITADTFHEVWTTVNDLCIADEDGTVEDCASNADAVVNNLVAFVSSILPDVSTTFDVWKKANSNPAEYKTYFTQVDRDGNVSAKREMLITQSGGFVSSPIQSVLLNGCLLGASKETFEGDVNVAPAGTTMTAEQNFEYTAGCVIPMNSNKVFGFKGGYNLSWNLSGTKQ